MNIVSLLEEIARTSHHNLDIEKLLKDKPADIKIAIENNDAESLKAIFNKTDLLANRTTIFEV